MSEFKSLSDNERAKHIRIQSFEGVLREQFQLAYFGKISVDASERMTIQERRTMYKILVEQKQEEKKQHEEALRQSKAQSAANRGRRR